MVFQSLHFFHSPLCNAFAGSLLYCLLSKHFDIFLRHLQRHIQFLL